MHELAALQQLAAAQTTVLRGRQTQVVAARTLVPVDLRLIDIAQLQVDESALTSESVTVAKHTAALTDTGDSALGNRLTGGCQWAVRPRAAEIRPAKSLRPTGSARRCRS